MEGRAARRQHGCTGVTEHLPRLMWPKEKMQPSAPPTTDWSTSATVPEQTSAWGGTQWGLARFLSLRAVASVFCYICKPKAHYSWSHEGRQPHRAEELTNTGPGTQGPPTLIWKVQDT